MAHLSGRPHANPARLPRAHQRGKSTVTDGPFTEAKEIIGGFSIFSAASKEEAIALALRFAEAGGGDAETEVRQLWDMPEA